jgi:hypothetical protein
VAGKYAKSGASGGGLRAKATRSQSESYTLHPGTPATWPHRHCSAPRRGRLGLNWGVPARQADLTAFPSTSTMSPGHGQKHTLWILCNPRSPQLGRSSLHSPCWLALATEYAADEGQIIPTEHDENEGAVTLDELLHAQSRDEACKRLLSVHPQRVIYYVDNRGLLVPRVTGPDKLAFHPDSSGGSHITNTILFLPDTPWHIECF